MTEESLNVYFIRALGIILCAHRLKLNPQCNTVVAKKKNEKNKEIVVEASEINAKNTDETRK